MNGSDVEEFPGLGRCRRFGDGAPVVILSNPQAEPDAWATRHVEALVSAGFRAITFVHTGSNCRYDAVTRDVVAFIVALEAGQVRLLGWSQGAAIAQEVALAAPEVVASAALVATYGRQNSFDRVLQGAWDELDQADAALNNLRLAMVFLTGEPPHRLGDDRYMEDRIAALRGWATRLVQPESRRRSRAFIDSYQDRLGALGGIRVPCLVVGFELDTDTFVQRAREVASNIPGCRYIEIPDAGHLLPITDPHAVIEPVIDFFRELDSAR